MAIAMENVWVWLGPLVGGLIIYAVIQAAVKAPGASLRQKFVKLGNLRGRRKAEIVGAVGPPSSVSSAPDGKTVCQWMATGYHIVLVFNGEICEGVTHEHSA